jgi:type II secretory pathway component PulJ
MRKNEEGLTLIEIVLGLTISAVIFVLLLGTMRLGNRSQEKE